MHTVYQKKQIYVTYIIIRFNYTNNTTKKSPQRGSFINYFFINVHSLQNIFNEWTLG